MADDLKERLRKGIVSESLHEDNETELFDVDAADELCEDALERIEKLEAALVEIFDHECRTSQKSFIACVARDALWPQAPEGKDD